MTEQLGFTDVADALSRQPLRTRKTCRKAHRKREPLKPNHCCESNRVDVLLSMTSTEKIVRNRIQSATNTRCPEHFKKTTAVSSVK